MAKLIELENVSREYGLDGTVAIINHPEHGRLFIADGFGGQDSLDGGSVRWRHGMAIKLQPDDTLDSLRNTPWNDYCDLIDAMLKGHDDSRPVLDWHGPVIESLAKQAGL